MRFSFLLGAACLLLVGCQEQEGCTDPAATNFNAEAVVEDGSCEYASAACEPVTFDGHTYGVVEIGDQCWFNENLRTTMYADGTSIPTGLDSAAWFNATTGASAVYGEGTTDCVSNYTDFDACDEALSLVEFGRLYNWHAVNDERQLCPNGWHVPAGEEWIALRDYVASQGFEGAEGGALKATSGWYSEPQNGWEETDGTDDFNFDGRPAGFRGPVFLTTDQNGFAGAGSHSYWWSGTESDVIDGAFASNVDWLTDNLGLNNYLPVAGFSVRCLKDE